MPKFAYFLHHKKKKKKKKVCIFSFNCEFYRFHKNINFMQLLSFWQSINQQLIISKNIVLYACNSNMQNMHVIISYL